MLSWLILKPLAVLTLVVGAVTLPTPLPIGAPLIAGSLAVLVATSSTARAWLRAARYRYGSVDDFLSRVETRLGRRYGTHLKRTRPFWKRARRQTGIPINPKASKQPRA